jgi:hypothetical protein
MPNEIEKGYEARHLANIQKAQKRVDALYKSVIDKIYKKASGLKLKGSVFRISDYPEFNKEVDRILITFRQEVDVTLVNGIKGEWELSTEKNAAVIHKAYGKENVVDQVDRMLYDPQAASLKEFTERKVAGLGLSDRVHKYTNQFRNEIEQNLFSGLFEGRSAAEMARDHIQYLQQPDKLFRRVKTITRSGKAILRLSKAAQEYKPGKGVYRSSRRNAMRLTRDTVNDSYRQADMNRYQTLPFILGYDVNLSNNHPRTDICDDLKGTYPKTFVWLKWHNQCICNCTSKLASPEEFDKYQQALIDGTAANFKFSGGVSAVPSNFTTYVENNQGKMDNWKRKPDWVLMNDVKI